MGRHGGGSRSGGSHSSHRSGGGSRSGGSSTRTSTTPFHGCYNRSYYDRHGRYHRYYTSSRSFGTTRGWNAGNIFALIFVTIHMCVMIAGLSSSFVTLGGKVHGDTSRIKIVDPIDVLTQAEEESTIDLLYSVYHASGMPVTVYTDDFGWRKYYDSLEVYSEELYYEMGFDEDAMIILFTTDKNDEFYDWEYDIYCGDDTVKCLSDASFDKLLANFQKGMANQNLYQALDYSWNSIMDELGKTYIDWSGAPMILILLAFYSIFYIAILSGTKKQYEAYKYFKENPDKLSEEPMTLYSECPSCGASNSLQAETCPYCGTLLKISDNNMKFIKRN